MTLSLNDYQTDKLKALLLKQVLAEKELPEWARNDEYLEMLKMLEGKDEYISETTKC